MTTSTSDVRLAIRSLGRSPLFATVAILSLALGIGANTAIFTLIDQIVLRKLPVTAPEQLVMLYQQGAHNGSNMGTRMHSYPMYQDFQKRAEPLAELLCRRLVAASVSIDNQTERLEAEIVSGNYFTMLGVKPAVGRLFNSQEDDQVYQGHPVVVLSYTYWNNRFARDPGVVGKKILVNDFPMTIIGVSAAGFAGIDPARSPQIRVPVQMKEAMLPEWPWLHVDNRRARWVQVFGRLKPGYTVESAAAPLQGLFTQIRTYEMTLPAAKDWSQYSRDQFMKGRMRVESAATGFSGIRNDFSTALIVLMCMVGLVLLIACANVANLLIARAFMRQKEIAVRLSLGASRGRLVRQLLVESLVLSAAGGVVGLALAFLLTRGLLRLVPTDGQPLMINAYPDARILMFTVALTFLTGIVFGLLPALRASRPDPWTTLKDTVGSIAGTGGSLFLRKGLVTAQVALSFLLLFGAGLFVKSLQNLRDDRNGHRAGQPGDLPAVAGAQWLHQRARDAVLHRSARAAALRARRQVGGDCRRVDPERFRMGQLDVGRGPSGEGRRGHAGVHELALASILRDDEDCAAGRAGLPSDRHQGGRQGRHRQSQVRRTLLQGRIRGR